MCCLVGLDSCIYIREPLFLYPGAAKLDSEGRSACTWRPVVSVSLDCCVSIWKPLYAYPGAMGEVSLGTDDVKGRLKALYGPGRTARYQQIKGELTRSSVLQDGEYNFTSNRLKPSVWKTSHSTDFAVSTLASSLHFIWNLSHQIK